MKIVTVTTRYDCRDDETFEMVLQGVAQMFTPDVIEELKNGGEAVFTSGDPDGLSVASTKVKVETVRRTP